jgi:hypothetical protein
MYIFLKLVALIVVGMLALFVLVVKAAQFLDRPKFKRGDVILDQCTEPWEPRIQYTVLEVGKRHYHLQIGGSLDITVTKYMPLIDSQYEKATGSL